MVNCALTDTFLTILNQKSKCAMVKLELRLCMSVCELNRLTCVCVFMCIDVQSKLDFLPVISR